MIQYNRNTFVVSQPWENFCFRVLWPNARKIQPQETLKLITDAVFAMAFGLQFSAPHPKVPSAAPAAQNSMSLLLATSADGLPSYWLGRKRTRDLSNQKHHPFQTTFLLPLAPPGRPLYNVYRNPTLKKNNRTTNGCSLGGMLYRLRIGRRGCRKLIIRFTDGSKDALGRAACHIVPGS